MTGKTQIQETKDALVQRVLKLRTRDVIDAKDHNKQELASKKNKLQHSLDLAKKRSNLRIEETDMTTNLKESIEHMLDQLENNDTAGAAAAFSQIAAHKVAAAMENLKVDVAGQMFNQSGAE